MADDTNIWVNNASVTYKKTSEGIMKPVEAKNGQGKIQSLLGMLWSVALHRQDQELDIVRIHSPSQVLPKANASTMLDRMRRWGLFTSSETGVADVYGGKELYQMFERIPLKMMISCSDALPTNHLVQALSLQDWRQKASCGDFNAATTMHIMFTCAHHAACLAKKPGLLSVPNLCSNMVRLTRAIKSSKFQDNFIASLDFVADSADRRIVSELPHHVKRWWNENSGIVRLCLQGLSEDNQETILSVFNDPWCFRPDAWRSSRVVHWCAAGCCPSPAEARKKIREALRLLLEQYPSIPLLYRWKHWEPALNWAIRGTLCNGVLQLALSMCTDQNSMSKVADLDPDSPDLSFALKQEVRLSKSVSFITSDMIHQNLGISFLVSNPLADFMDHVSYVETCRSRVNLRASGLLLPDSKCDATLDSVRLMNWRLLKGEKTLS